MAGAKGPARSRQRSARSTADLYRVSIANTARSRIERDAVRPAAAARNLSQVSPSLPKNTEVRPADSSRLAHALRQIPNGRRRRSAVTGCSRLKVGRLERRVERVIHSRWVHSVHSGQEVTQSVHVGRPGRSAGPLLIRGSGFRVTATPKGLSVEARLREWERNGSGMGPEWDRRCAGRLRQPVPEDETSGSSGAVSCEYAADLRRLIPQSLGCGLGCHMFTADLPPVVESTAASLLVRPLIKADARVCATILGLPLRSRSRAGSCGR
jgi:hypothetical protein